MPTDDTNTQGATPVVGAPGASTVPAVDTQASTPSVQAGMPVADTTANPLAPVTEVPAAPVNETSTAPAAVPGTEVKQEETPGGTLPPTTPPTQGA